MMTVLLSYLLTYEDLSMGSIGIKCLNVSRKKLTSVRHNVMTTEERKNKVLVLIEKTGGLE